MILKNAIFLLSGFLNASYYRNNVKIKGTRGQVSTLTNSTELEGWRISPSQSWGINTNYDQAETGMLSNYTYPCMFLGDGDTPPTSDDYKLSGNPVNLTTQGYLATAISNDNITFTGNAINNTESEVTIKEVGIGFYVDYRAASTFWACMWSREVLDTPIVVPAGAGKVITITIDFSKLWNN